MRNSKSYKYKNYGSIPQNEYTNANPEISADAAAVLEDDPQPDETAHPQRLMKRQSMHPAGRKQLLGWSRTWKANGWRAESASQDNESTSMGGYSGDVRKNSRPL